MIPVNEPLLGSREKELLGECIDSGWISSEGPFVERFERTFADFIGVRHGVAVCNGTAALETGLHALGIDGGEVIMPTFTIISCAWAALRVGAKPVLVDIEPETWNMDVGQLEKKINSRTSAIMPVHMYGHPVDMDPLLALADKHGIPVLEDACEIHGGSYKGRNAGTLGKASAFSFYANKIITTGEGGMVLTDDDLVAERARSYRNLSFIPGKRFWHEDPGYNFRMTNLQAAVGVAQVERAEEFVAIKRRWAEVYRKNLENIPGVRFQIEKEWARSVYWMYCVELTREGGPTAETVMQALREEGVGTRPFFTGLDRQPVLQQMGLFKGEHYPVSDRASRYGFYLPSGLTLTEAVVEKVCDSLRRVLG